MDAIETLNQEIHLEELALQAIEKELAIIRKSGRPDIVRLHQILDFSRNFEDRCHRRKEEEHLFRHLRTHGNAASHTQLEEMARELEEETRLIRIISEATAEFSLSDPNTVDPIRRALHDYHDSMRQRVHKENSYLLPLLRRSLSEDEKNTLMEEFSEVDRETLGVEARERYERVLRQAVG